MTSSPFARRSAHYVDRGYSIVPVAPGTKRPGNWSKAEGWKGMFDWERFNDRGPTELEIGHWDTWPEAGLGLLCGRQSRIVALDRDYDTRGTDALEAIIPYSPVKKKGAKGYTAFFQYKGEPSKSWNINGMRVLDMLSDGRQTLMPGTLHPDGHTYVYLTEDCLEDFDADQLPMLPDDFVDQVDRVLAPYQSDEDRKYQARRKHSDTPAAIDTSLSISAQYFKELNLAALDNLGEWVPKLIATAKVERDGYRCIATWRNCEKANVGIHMEGIFDFGGNYGMTPIDLVMYAQGVTFRQAAEALRACLSIKQEEHIVMTVGGAPATQSAMVQPTAPPPAPILMPSPTSTQLAPALPNFITNPPGILGTIAHWIRATSPKEQPELATAAAIALGATVMGRLYRSNMSNFTSLYIVMVAKSTEGKEHPQNCVERALVAAGLTNLIAGSGYTSPGAIFSTLLKQPSHIVIIDEIGKLLKASRAKGNSHGEGAIDKLVEAFGKLHGVMRPQAYSTMTMPKGMPTGERLIYNPAITLLGATTPGTFFANVTDDMIEGGFLGRLLLVESSQPRQLNRFVEQTDPPQSIIDWCMQVHKHDNGGNLADVAPAEMPAKPMPMFFDAGCLPMMREFELALNDLKDRHEAEGMDVILGRSYEKALRLSMIACKAARPNDTLIQPVDLKWAIEYVRFSDLAMLASIKRHRTSSVIEAALKKAVSYIKAAKRYSDDHKFKQCLMAGAMPHAKLLKLMHMSSRDFSTLMDTGIESGVIGRSPGAEFGYAGDCYFVVEGE